MRAWAFRMQSCTVFLRLISPLIRASTDGLGDALGVQWARGWWPIVTVSGLVQYAVMTWDLGVHLATSPRCLRNHVLSLVSWLSTVRFRDHMTLPSCDASYLVTAGASLSGT